MNTEPVGAITDIGVGPAFEVRRAQSARIAFAVVLLFASLLAVALDEARHWKPAVDLGVQLHDEMDGIVSVRPGGIAERAGLHVGRSPRALDGVELDEDPWQHRETVAATVLISRNGHTYARPGVSLVRISVRPSVHREARVELCARHRPSVAVDAPPVDGRDACTAERLDFVLNVDGPQRFVRDPLVDAPFLVLWALPIALFAASIAARLTPTHGADRRRRSFVWPAVAITIVVPLWLHVFFIAVFTNDSLLPMYELAVLSTVPPWLALIVTAADGAVRADGDITRAWPVLLTTIIPLLFFIVPGVCVAYVSLLLLHGLVRWRQRVLAREAPAIQAADVVTPG